MALDDTAYYLQRAATERLMAAKSDRANVAAIHAELARQYQALADKADLRPTLRIAFPTGNREQSSDLRDGRTRAVRRHLAQMREGD